MGAKEGGKRTLEAVGIKITTVFGLGMWQGLGEVEG